VVPVTAPLTETVLALSALAHEVVITGHAPPGCEARLEALSPLAGNDLTRCWDEVLWALRDHLDIENGLITWREIDDSLTCSYRTQHARDIARERFGSALEILAGQDGGPSL